MKKIQTPVMIGEHRGGFFLAINGHLLYAISVAANKQEA